MFKLGLSSDKEDEEQEMPPPRVMSSRGGKRSRRRRHAKSRTKVEPMTNETIPKKHHDAPMTKSDIYFALDCEMVGVGPDGLSSVVARVTIVNWENVVVLDTFVKVPESITVTDYRTYVSGITAKDIESEHAMPFEEVRDQVKNILRGKILIGHGLENDLTALGISHPWFDVRDTTCYVPYMREVVDPQTGKLVIRPRKLRDLTWEVLGRQIQPPGRPHCPIDDAVASLDLYKAVRFQWEHDLSQQQREQAFKQERRSRYNFFWNGSTEMSQPPPPGMYNPCEPHNVHLLPIPLDPRLPVPNPYGVMPGYSHTPMPPPPPEPQPQPLCTSPSSSWWIFRRPKTPPPEYREEDKDAQKVQELEEPVMEVGESVLPDIQYLSLGSTSNETSTDGSSVVVGGLPFYSKTTIWGQSST